jgi:hypothetical protein
MEFPSYFGIKFGSRTQIHDILGIAIEGTMVNGAFIAPDGWPLPIYP